MQMESSFTPCVSKTHSNHMPHKQPLSLMPPRLHIGTPIQSGMSSAPRLPHQPHRAHSGNIPILILSFHQRLIHLISGAILPAAELHHKVNAISRQSNFRNQASPGTTASMQTPILCLAEGVAVENSSATAPGRKLPQPNGFRNREAAILARSPPRHACERKRDTVPQH